MCERLVAVGRNVHRITRLPQALRHGPRERLEVLDEKHAHERQYAPRIRGVPDFAVALIGVSCSPAINRRVLIRRGPRELVFAVLALRTAGTRAAHAQETSATTDSPAGISLPAAREAAAERAPDVTLARAREEIAQAQVNVAGALANPTLTVTTAQKTGAPRNRRQPPDASIRPARYRCLGRAIGR